MGISDFISRLTNYYSRNGFASTLRRVGLAVMRALFSNRMVVYYCDLATLVSPLPTFPSHRKVENLKSFAELQPQDLQEMTSFWNPDLAYRNIKERFARGAWLWVIKSGDDLAGYGWTMRALTIEPYYFPLASEDVHLFDFHVFPQYRGQGMNPLLVAYILHSLARSGVSRAFIEVAEWNEAQLASLRKTPFHQLGRASSFTILGHKFTHWIGKQNGERPLETKQDGGNAPAMATSHEQ
jgi:ribosomal protein S18 acetylase RimI-like enzyme